MTAVSDIQKLPCFNEIDRQFAAFLSRVTGDSSEPFILACLMASRAIEEGDTCAGLEYLSGKRLGDIFDENFFTEDPEAADFRLPPLKEWIKAVGSNSAAVSPEGGPAPLVLDSSNRLYLYRYYNYEKTVAEKIRMLADETPPAPEKTLAEKTLNRLFPPVATEDEPDMQKEAAVASLNRKICLVSGGPGTGKTSTVAKILALLAEQASSEGREFTALLAAPTGKAAARLREAILSSLESLDIPPHIKDRIPSDASTIHRLLRNLPRTDDSGRSPSFPEYSVLVIDESSMMDIRTAAELFSAIPRTAGIILLGDRHQLSSVEAGAVFASICGSGIPDDKRKSGPLKGSVIDLKKSWRFSGDDPIGIAAEAVKSGDWKRLISLIDEDQDKVKLIEPAGRAGNSPELKEIIPRRFSGLFRENSPADAIGSMKEFALLCALRRGPSGAEGINIQAENLLAAEGLIPPRFKSGAVYTGMPVMITVNDYNLGLYNGDTGVILKNEETGAFYAAFPSVESGGAPREFPVLILPPYEKVYAMTVHKSQGSEFNDVAFILPETPSPVLTRELIYTAVTRARNTVTIFGSRETLKAGISKPTIRRSGLMDALYGPD